MKRFKTLLLLAVAAIFISACGKEENPEPIIVEDVTYVGKMTVLSLPGGPVLHEQENVTIKIEMGTGDMIDMEMVAVKFAPTMPMSLDVMVPGISITIIAAGYSLQGDNIIPLAAGGPFPQFTMKNIEGSMTSQNLAFSMICGTYPLSFTGVKVE